LKISTEQFRQVALREIADENTQQLLKKLPETLVALRKASFTDYADPDAARRTGAAIRAEALENLPLLLETFEKNVIKNGGYVFWAKDAHSANQYIVDVAQKNRVPFVTKGKSMVTEELGLNEALEENGIQVYESDLGEFITQLFKLPPFHILGPAINIPVARISDIFLQKGIISDPELDPAKLGLAVRRFLREKFQHLQMGITGVNMVVAETGTIVNVENEGNIRMSKSCPRIQVSVMSIEKIVPTMVDAFYLLRLLCRSAGGQDLGAYVSFDTGPKKNFEIDGPEQLHIVILDNGRSRLYKDQSTRETLRCIRCGACINICPIYGKIGGYPYGWAYSGPMGQIVNPPLLGLDRTRDLFEACTLCGKCKDVCPVGIDHPKLILKYRYMNASRDSELRGVGIPRVQKIIDSAYTFISEHPVLWNFFGGILRRVLNQYAHENIIRKGPKVLSGWFQYRDLPLPPSASFHSKWYKMLKTESFNLYQQKGRQE
jgi:L-lactate dehydrogenase complex protein LldF